MEHQMSTLIGILLPQGIGMEAVDKEDVLHLWREHYQAKSNATQSMCAILHHELVTF